MADQAPIKSFAGKRLTGPPKVNGRPKKLSTIMSLGAKVRPVQAVSTTRQMLPPLPALKGN